MGEALGGTGQDPSPTVAWAEPGSQLPELQGDATSPSSVVGTLASPTRLPSGYMAF